MEAMGPYANKGGSHDSPMAEHKGDQDEIDLAIFGKRPQLKVRSQSPCVSLRALKLISDDSENLASFLWSV